MVRSVDLINMKSGHLSVLELTKISSGTNRKVLCLCDCGREVLVVGSEIANGRRTDCGAGCRLRYVDDKNKSMCTKCGTWKELYEFALDPSRPKGRRSLCRHCDWLNYLKRNYKLNEDDYVAIIDSQHGLCPICDKSLRFNLNGTLGKLDIDHDHSCCPVAPTCGECIRGILHGTCNNFLGKLEKRLNNLPGMLRYIGYEWKNNY